MTNKKKSNGTWQQTIFSLMIESPSGKKIAFYFLHGCISSTSNRLSGKHLRVIWV
jgi:hypothetical protein